MRMQDRVDECTLTVCVYVGEPRDTVEWGESTREREQRGSGTCNREREREIVCALEREGGRLSASPVEQRTPVEAGAHWPSPGQHE